MAVPAAVYLMQVIFTGPLIVASWDASISWNMLAMESEPNDAVNVRPAKLRQISGIETKEITLSTNPIEHYTQKDTVVLVRALGISDENGFPGRMTMESPETNFLSITIELHYAVYES